MITSAISWEELVLLRAASDLGSRLGAVFGVAKAVATLTQRGEIGPPSVRTAMGIATRGSLVERHAGLHERRRRPRPELNREYPPSRRVGQRDDGKVRSLSFATIESAHC